MATVNEPKTGAGGAHPSDDILLKIYKKVTLIRQNDNRSVAVLKAGRLSMPYYSPRGQEVIPSSVSTALRDDDYICTIYRGIHDMLAKGMPLRDLWAEIAGRVTGICKGKGGPMHLTYPDKGIMVTTGIVGSSMPIANGLAWASQMDGNDKVTVAYFGDGASNIGAFHEALNLAGLWKLPVVFVCQNNRFAEHTAYNKSTAADRIADRAIGYNMPGVQVDGNSPVEMYQAAKEAIDRARGGGGPTLIEAMTFRFSGHVYGDDDAYMDPAMKAEYVAADPVPRFRSWLISEGIATEDNLSAIEKAIEAELDDAVSYAETSAFPGLEELERDVLAEEFAA